MAAAAVPTHAVGSGNLERSIAAARITTQRLCFTTFTSRRIHHIHLFAGLYQFAITPPEGRPIAMRTMACFGATIIAPLLLALKLFAAS